VESGLSRTPNDPIAPVLVENDDRWALVLRVAGNSKLAKAPQLHDILVYICKRALTDPGASIREHEIGCNALGRKADFNPHEDNIVRVQISHLRKRLEEYFTTDGKNEPMRITIPKGAYVPHFEPKEDAWKVDSVLPAKAGNQRPRSGLVLLLSLSTGLLLVVCLFLALRPPASQSNRAMGTQLAGQDPFWSRIFGGGQTARVVVADTCLVMVQDILHTDLSVADYLSRQYPEEFLNRVPDRDLRSALQLIAGRQYTSLADINIASRLVELSRGFGGQGDLIRYARHLNIRDFKTENFVLIGSRRGIPWVQLFEPQLNFAFEEDKTTHRFYFRNKNPQAGELSAYLPTENGAAETYADVAFLPNLGNTGSVLILSGITMEGAEAAGELVAGKDFSKQLIGILGPQGVHEHYFEILLKTRSVAGAARSSQIVTYRVIQPGAASN
jgi:hypothetical protein